MTEFSFDLLRRRPDVEADNLFAVDAADRLLLDTAATALAGCMPGEVVTVGDRYGALTLGAASGGVLGIRTHQDALSGELALAANADRFGLRDAYHSLPLGAELLTGARVVLLQVPRSLDSLEEIAGTIARYSSPEVTVYAGGMVKHLALAMNEVLARRFDRVQAGLSRQKARVIVASGFRPAAAASEWPRREFHEDLGLWVCAHGGAFAGTRVDIGTRFLLGFLSRAKPDATSAVDLGCGTGVLAAALATSRPQLRIVATDQSAAAVASATATADANGVADRVRVLRDDGLIQQPDASAELIVLNPPFHIGAAVHAGGALRLFEDCARVLAPGGELWTVFNSHLGYRPALTRIVGPTRQIGRNPKFTVTVSTPRS
ncbi:MAG: methyltransferase [Terrimesophilobacter sp.]